jgi:hypothetical protein
MLHMQKLLASTVDQAVFVEVAPQTASAWIVFWPWLRRIVHCRLVLRLGSVVTAALINDRDPFVPGRHIDLTPAAARAIGLEQIGEVSMSRWGQAKPRSSKNECASPEGPGL